MPVAAPIANDDAAAKWEAKIGDFVMLRPDFTQEPNAQFWLALVLGFENIAGAKNYLLQYYEPADTANQVTGHWHPNKTQAAGRSFHNE
jgi:hypothetical protein